MPHRVMVNAYGMAAIEIASHLQVHPAVGVAQVVGVADEMYGEVAGFKVPRHVRFVTEWPVPPPRCGRSACASSSKPS